jgi:hypothetical protein
MNMPKQCASKYRGGVKYGLEMFTYLLYKICKNVALMKMWHAVLSRIL